MTTSTVKHAPMLKSIQLRDYQAMAADYGIDFANGEARSHATSECGRYLLFSSPTGTGKSYVELYIRNALINDSQQKVAVISPSVEILAGLASKLGYPVDWSKESGIEFMGYELDLWTPTRLCNRMLNGDINGCYDTLIIDECHHSEAKTYDDLIHATGVASVLGFTASPFRGSVRGTVDFKARWGEAQPIINIPEALELGVWNSVKMFTWGLVDDAHIAVRNGEFDVAAENEALSAVPIYESLCSLITDVWNSPGGPMYRKPLPTMISVNSSETVQRLVEAMEVFDLPYAVITADTSRSDRMRAFQRCMDCEAILVQINVVSEGVDLPFGRWIDFSPTMSPVKWIQRFGRITRVTGRQHEYYCTNRNLLRFAYLLEGACPPSVIREAVEVFNVNPSNSSNLSGRVLDNDVTNKLKSFTVPLADGTIAICYAFSMLEGNHQRQYAAIMRLHSEEVFWASKTNILTPGEDVKWGKWARCEPPTVEKGYRTIPAYTMSEAQRRWWQKSAGWHGLDASFEPTAREFQILPVLADCKKKLA